jgi:hypothetical protein
MKISVLSRLHVDGFILLAERRIIALNIVAHSILELDARAWKPLWFAWPLGGAMAKRAAFIMRKFSR